MARSNRLNYKVMVGHMGMYITTVSKVQRQHFAEMQLYLTAFSFKLNKFDVTKPKTSEKKQTKKKQRPISLSPQREKIATENNDRCQD